MDRKNKKAAQVAAAAAGGKEGGGGKGRGAGNIKRDAQGGGAAGGAARNALLTGGSTAPTRGRPLMSMPLKATISPSAPAPPLKDTDFASFGALDESDQLPNAPAQGKAQDATAVAFGNDSSPDTTQPQDGPVVVPITQQKPPSPVQLPISAPRTSTAPANAVPADFGPIGSPPRPPNPNHHSNSPSRLNGSSGITFSPGTSPRAHNALNGVAVGSPNNNNFLSTSPFSAPGTQSVFLSYNEGGMMRTGLAASLGSGATMGGGRRGWGNNNNNSEFGSIAPSQVLSSSVQQQRINGNGGRGDYDIGLEYEDYSARGGSRRRGTDTAVEDGDFEDFLPSSLTDLLTPEERSRRMSRSNSGQGAGATLYSGNAAPLGVPLSGSTGGSGLGHRYSRSVPAPSLLGDIKSIWSDNNTTSGNVPNSTTSGLPSSPNTRGFLSGGTPGSFTSSTLEDHGLAGSPSSLLISPSNASAAFLPGLHHHYLNAKAKQQQQLGIGSGLGRGLRNTSSPLIGSGRGTNSTTSSYLQGGTALTPPASTHLLHTYRPSPFDLTQSVVHNPNLNPNANPSNTRPIPLANEASGDSPSTQVLLSPSSRALQSHAPGQSLPQGLAAGYSRIHALPPLPAVASPGPTSSTFGASSPRLSGSFGTPYGATEWGNSGSSPTLHGGNNGNTGSDVGGLDSMFSRLSYSAATTRASGNTAAPSAPPGLQRNVSGGRWPSAGHPQGALSPLSGPVVTRDDDDDLFSMDG